MNAVKESVKCASVGVTTTSLMKVVGGDANSKSATSSPVVASYINAAPLTRPRRRADPFADPPSIRARPDPVVAEPGYRLRQCGDLLYKWHRQTARDVDCPNKMPCLVRSRYPLDPNFRAKGLPPEKSLRL